MAKITYVDSSGTSRTVEGELGSTVMETALRNDIPEIEAECGGACSCATCHGYLDPAWAGRLPPQSEDEALLLDGALHTEATSRLTCQITMTPELDGLIVRLPVSQF
jgi:2Fe-2S ferredoxin